MSTQKLCSTYILTDFKVFTPALPTSFNILKCTAFLPVLEISATVETKVYSKKQSKMRVIKYFPLLNLKVVVVAY